MSVNSISHSSSNITTNLYSYKDGGKDKNPTTVSGHTPDASDPAMVKSNAAKVMYGQGNRGISNTQINEAIAAIEAQYKDPDQAHEAILNAAVKNGVNAQQLVEAHPEFTQVAVDEYLKSKGIFPPEPMGKGSQGQSSESTNSASNTGTLKISTELATDGKQKKETTLSGLASIEDIGLRLNVDFALQGRSALGVNVRTSMAGEGNKNISNNDLNLAIDQIFAKYSTEPDKAAELALQALAANNVNAQQIADLGRPGLTRQVIDDYLAVRASKIIDNFELASAVDSTIQYGDAGHSHDTKDYQESMFGEGNKDISSAELNVAIDKIYARYGADPAQAAKMTLDALTEVDVNAQQIADLGRPGLTRQVIVDYLASQGVMPPVQATRAQFDTAKASYETAVTNESNAYFTFKNAGPAEYDHAGAAWQQTQTDLREAYWNYDEVGESFFADKKWSPTGGLPIARDPVFRSDGAPIPKEPTSEQFHTAMANYDAAISSYTAIYSKYAGMVPAKDAEAVRKWENYLTAKNLYSEIGAAYYKDSKFPLYIGSSDPFHFGPSAAYDNRDEGFPFGYGIPPALGSMPV